MLRFVRFISFWVRGIQMPWTVFKMELCQVDFRLSVHRPHGRCGDICVRSVKRAAGLR